MLAAKVTMSKISCKNANSIHHVTTASYGNLLILVKYF